jgi:hypothetical protein
VPASALLAQLSFSGGREGNFGDLVTSKPYTAKVGFWHKVASLLGAMPCPELGLKPTGRSNARTSQFDPEGKYLQRRPVKVRAFECEGDLVRAALVQPFDTC